MPTFREKLMHAVQTQTGFDVNPDDFFFETGVDGTDIDYEKFDARFKKYPVYTWVCTDTPVGIYAITLDGVLVAYTTQNARKNPVDVYYFSKLIQDLVVKTVCECELNREFEKNYSLVDASILDSDYDKINAFENRMLVTEFPALVSMGLTIEQHENKFTVLKDDVRLNQFSHESIDTIEQCAKRHVGHSSDSEMFIKVFLLPEM
jgi:hypothetical protein